MLLIVSYDEPPLTLIAPASADSCFGYIIHLVPTISAQYHISSLHSSSGASPAESISPPSRTSA